MLAVVIKLVLASRVVISKTGAHATLASGDLYRSTDYGLNWIRVPGTSFPTSNLPYFSIISMTQNAAYQLACQKNSDEVYESVNSGDTWTKVTFTDTVGCQGLAVSKDGTRRTLLSRKDNSNYHIWTWSSGTWTQRTFDAAFVNQHAAGNNRRFLEIDMSLNGKHQSFLFLGHNSKAGYLYRSSNFGASFVRGAYMFGGLSTGLRRFRDIAVSSNGQTQVVVVDTQGIWRSNDEGRTFNTITETGLTNDHLVEFRAVGMSGDDTPSNSHITALVEKDSAAGFSLYVRDETNNNWDTIDFPAVPPNEALGIAVSYEDQEMSSGAFETVQIVCFDYNIYRSINSGETWTEATVEDYSRPSPPGPPPPPPSGPSPPSPSPPPPSGKGSSGGNNNGAIIGGAVGGTVLIVLCGVSYYIKCGPFAQRSFTNEMLL